MFTFLCYLVHFYALTLRSLMNILKLKVFVPLITFSCTNSRHYRETSSASVFFISCANSVSFSSVIKMSSAYFLPAMTTSFLFFAICFCLCTGIPDVQAKWLSLQFLYYCLFLPVIDAVLWHQITVLSHPGERKPPRWGADIRKWPKLTFTALDTESGCASAVTVNPGHKTWTSLSPHWHRTLCLHTHHKNLCKPKKLYESAKGM